jgi:hypothetical protein
MTSPPASGAISWTNSTDYIYNYFENGLDVVFDGKLSIVKRVIVHTNSPNHAIFNTYSKCNFSATFSENLIMKNNHIVRDSAGSVAAGPEPPAAAPKKGKGASAAPPPSLPTSGKVVTAETTFAAIEQLLGYTPRPMINDKGSVDSPFGRTLYYAYPGAMLEIMKKGTIASVSFFQIME